MDSGPPVVLRPGTAAFRKWTWAGLPLAVAWLPLVWVRGRTFGILLTLGLLIVVLACAVLMVLLYLRSARVELHEDRVVYRRLPFRRTELARAGLAGVLATYHPFGSPRDYPQLVLTSGRRRIRLIGGYWPQDLLEQIAAWAGVPVEAGTLTSAEFEERVPGGLPFRERHSILTGFLLAGAVLVVATVGVIGWFKHEGLPPFERVPPRSVTDTDVAAQQDLLADLRDALPARWRSPEVGIWDCEDDEQYSGWNAHSETVARRPGRYPTRAEFTALERVLARRGFDTDPVGRSRRDSSGAISMLVTDQGPGWAERAVRARFDPQGWSLEITGACRTSRHPG